jgi:hypothetical protein
LIDLVYMCGNIKIMTNATTTKGQTMTTQTRSDGGATSRDGHPVRPWDIVGYWETDGLRHWIECGIVTRVEGDTIHVSPHSDAGVDLTMSARLDAYRCRRDGATLYR